MSEQMTFPGKVVSHWRLILLRVEACWIVQRRHWTHILRAVVYSWVILFSLGIGFGSQVKPSIATENMPYVNYIAPFLLITNGVVAAADESTFPILSGFRDKKDYWIVTLTPLTPGELLGGQIIWTGIKVLFDILLLTLLCLALGIITSLSVLLIIPVALLAGLSIGVPLMAMAATTYHNDARLTVVLKLAIFPMAFFSGTFFSVNYVPDFLHFLPWLSPIWHGNEIARGILFHQVSLTSIVGHITFLITLLIIGTLISRKFFYRRLVT